MDATTEARMHAMAREAGYYAGLSLASGNCTDEGDNHRPALIEHSRLDALYVARNPLDPTHPSARVLQDMANSRSTAIQIAVADAFLDAPPESMIRKGHLRVIPDVSQRQLGSAEFFTRRDCDIPAIIAEGYPTRRAAEIEWNKREAERVSGCKRHDANPSRRDRFTKEHNRIRAHDHR